MLKKTWNIIFYLFLFFIISFSIIYFLGNKTESIKKKKILKTKEINDRGNKIIELREKIRKGKQFKYPANDKKAKYILDWLLNDKIENIHAENLIERIGQKDKNKIGFTLLENLKKYYNKSENVSDYKAYKIIVFLGRINYEKAFIFMKKMLLDNEVNVNNRRTILHVFANNKWKSTYSLIRKMVLDVDFTIAKSASNSCAMIKDKKCLKNMRTLLAKYKKYENHPRYKIPIKVLKTEIKEIELNEN